MSWIIRNLLKNRETTKASAIRNNDLYNDSYNDLLSIELMIEKLKKLGSLTADDMDIIEHVAYGNSLRSKVSPDGKQKDAISRRFIKICEMIAVSLGGHFTDDGYMDMITNKFNLTEAQQDKMRSYMKIKRN